MKKNNEEIFLEELNKEYKKIYYSPEFRIGRKVLIVKQYIKNLNIIGLIQKIYRSKMKEKNSIINNSDNKVLFKNNDKNQLNKYNGERIAVYSVNIGGYDNLLNPIYKSDNIDYYYISDKKPNDLGNWNYIDPKEYIKNLNVSNVKKARYIKIHPELFFSNYKYSIFVDGNIRVVGNISKLVNYINKNTGIGIHLHPYRECIYDEAVCCKKSGKGNSKEIDRQIASYKKEGMPEKFGLFETNVVVREHNNSNCRKIMELWWNEIESKSERDQLSLTYALWKNDFVSNDIGILGNDTRENPLVQVLDHRDNYKK